MDLPDNEEERAYHAAAAEEREHTPKVLRHWADAFGTADHERDAHIWKKDLNGTSHIVHSVNVTAWSTNGGAAMSRHAHIVAIQEHGIIESGLGKAKAEARDAGWNAEFGPTDPEHSRPSGGVGILTRAPMVCAPIKARTKAYVEAYASGR